MFVNIDSYSCFSCYSRSPEWPVKRIRMDSQVLNAVASLESAACSSIVSASQFSQWPGKQQFSGPIPWSPSGHLLNMLKKFTDHATFSHAASQGPRGVQVCFKFVACSLNFTCVIRFVPFEIIPLLNFSINISQASPFGE